MQLQRAKVNNPQTGTLETASYRVSKTAWLPEHMNNATQILNSRLRVFTGLSTENAEDLQVKK